MKPLARRLALTFLAASLLPLPPAAFAQTPAATPPATQPADTAAGQAAAEQWLALVDAGDYAGSWRAAASYFQGALDGAKWTASIGPVRQPLGKMLTRKLLVARFSSQMPGAPDGRYVFLQFQTDFENKKTAVETVVPMLDRDGHWRVSGYYVR